MAGEGKVYIVSGPSGSGKDTLINKALERLDNIACSISVTTRKPRNGEVDGVDYRFVDDPEFDRLVAGGELLEFKEVYGNRYGTPRKEIEEITRSGRDVLLEIDVKGALDVRSKLRDCILIFIMPPSMEELKSRLANRRTDSVVEIESRFDVAPFEIKTGKDEFDFVLLNDDIERAASELTDLLRGE